MLSRPRPDSGVMDVPPEALVKPTSGHAAVQGKVSTVVGVASCGIHGELLPGSWPKPRLGEAEIPRPRVIPCSYAYTLYPELFEHSSWRESSGCYSCHRS
jgi:hypothetical protein